MSRAGKLIVITGPMKSGKSEEISRRVRRFHLAGQRVAVFAPDLSRHFTDSVVLGRDGGAAACVSIPFQNPGYIRAIVSELDSAIVIDDAQFFNTPIAGQPTITEIAVGFRDEGYTVIVAGLDLDGEGHPFGEMPLLMAHADEVIKLKAVCELCGNDAGYTIAKKPKTVRVSLDDAGYCAVCRRCFLATQKHAPGAFAAEE